MNASSDGDSRLRLSGGASATGFERGFQTRRLGVQFVRLVQHFGRLFPLSRRQGFEILKHRLD